MTISPREVIRRLVGAPGTPLQKGCAAGLGIAIGLLPIAPFQSLVALGLAFLFRLNRAVVYAGTLIWQPFTLPFILAAEYWLGCRLLGAGGPGIDFGAIRGWREVSEVVTAAAAPLFAGAGVLAAGSGLAVGLLTFALAARRDRRKRAPDVIHGGGPP